MYNNITYITYVYKYIHDKIIYISYLHKTSSWMLSMVLRPPASFERCASEAVLIFALFISAMILVMFFSSYSVCLLAKHA